MKIVSGKLLIIYYGFCSESRVPVVVFIDLAYTYKEKVQKRSMAKLYTNLMCCDRNNFDSVCRKEKFVSTVFYVIHHYGEQSSSIQWTFDG